MFLKKFGAAKTVKAGFLLTLEFAKKFFTGVGKSLTAGTKRREVAKQSKGTKYLLVLQAANNYLNKPTSSHLKSFFLKLKANPESPAYRRDLILDPFLNVLSMHAESKRIKVSHHWYRQILVREVTRKPR